MKMAFVYGPDHSRELIKRGRIELKFELDPPSFYETQVLTSDHATLDGPREIANGDLWHLTM
ncbi:hypothetical protein KSX_32710 [Ktedonospora formicarum]|uniref:Uncharacterized protein n=1 Tax=Ktedonospora formicarum TaxID=2778364 RepID=A0A8J3I315_9CHLR|nr:hypothetical protein KSX_32710 [Ktedonospora formicarum]